MNLADPTDEKDEYARLEDLVSLHRCNPAAYFRLGNAAFQLQRHDDAIRAFSKAAQLKPDWAAPSFGLAAALAASNQDKAAITAYRNGLTIDETNPDAHFALAHLLGKLGYVSYAAEHYAKASFERPEWIDPHIYRGALYEARGDYKNVYSAYNQAIKLGAPEGFALRRDLQVPIIATSSKTYETARQKYELTLNSVLTNPPIIVDPIREAGGNRFFLAYHGLDDRPLQEKLSQIMRAACPSLSWTAPHCANGTILSSPRRIGFASRFFHDHSVGRLMIGLLTHLHDSSGCHIHLFHTAPPEQDPIQREIESRADRVVILPDSLQAAREAIAEARLDVLFYPDIGMDPVTYFLAQARLAPIQCATWGHPVTTGISTIDYYLSCDAAEPSDADDHYTEKLVRLGGLPFSYRRPPIPEPIGSRDDFGLPKKATIYFLAQNLFKIHPDMDETLGKILKEDPAGRIMLLDGQDQNWSNILAKRFAESIGDDANRIIFLPRQNHENYMRLLALSDVSLDSFPFCGGNTTYQALAVGTPVVTLPGNFLRGRLSLAIYKHMGLMECVAANREDFAYLALRLGKDHEFRTVITEKIKNNANLIFDDLIFLHDARDFLLKIKPLSQS